ncbi:hypothetical protein EGM51_00550 [Verrucomicrobia bacterium S94]|nr:hypothetical protein EGM51_00550 [Verrucomicrobia bacterium S94]
MRQFIPAFCLAAYAAFLFFFGLRPFEIISGRTVSGDVAAMEDVRGGDRIRDNMLESRAFSLDVVLEPFSAEQYGPARIITYSRDPLAWNFTLGQQGEDVVFRLRTCENDAGIGGVEFQGDAIFSTLRPLHLAITYDGVKTRLYVDGILRAESHLIQGNFRNWGKNHRLVIHDEVTGGRFWNGRIYRFLIYNRRLTEKEIKAAASGTPADGSLYQYKPGSPDWKPLKYRNLFITVDKVFDPLDCVANILAFIPVPGLLFFVLPAAFRKKRWLSCISLPLALGLSISLFFESSQRFIVGRVPCLADLVYNVTGTLIGCIFLMICARRYNVILLKERKG